uniref:F-box domain-containing protein n=1 Tax=Trichobilharzia regenti TaxID=157069 RepID=A0AA85J5Z2_TRIRE|nr:unnamed protein product [Trichobilharzia regenti]
MLVLENIVSLLPLPDQKSVSLTCWRLYYTVSRKVFLLRRRFILREPLSNTSFLFCKQSDKCGSGENLYLADSVLPSTVCWASWVTSLSLKDTHPNPADLAFILRSCSRLVSLDLTGCDSLFNKTLGADLFLSNALERDAIRECLGSTLTKLTLANISSLSDENLENLFATFQSLSDIDLSGCLFDFNLTNVNLRRILTFPRFLSLVSNLEIESKFKQPCGGVLHLNSTSVSDESLRALAAIPGIHISGIYLDNCRELSDTGYLYLMMSDSVFNCLKKVSFSYPGPSVTCRVVEVLLERFSHILTYVKLSKWLFPANSRVPPLFKRCSALEYLDVSSCFTSPKLLVNSVSSAFTQLTSLVLSGYSGLLDEDLNCILKGLACCLKSLDISSCLNLTDVSLSSVCTYSPYLETFVASWCRGFTDSGIRNLSSNALETENRSLFSLKHLKSVNLCDCSRITGSSFLCNTSDSLNLYDLRSLRIGRIGSLDGSVLLSVPSIAPQLHVLDISRSSADDKTIEVLTTKLSNTLRELFVSGCEHLTDQALSSILTNIPFLRTLDISFCPYISPKAVLLFKSSMPYLYYLKSIYVGSYLKSARVS